MVHVHYHWKWGPSQETQGRKSTLWYILSLSITMQEKKNIECHNEILSVSFLKFFKPLVKLINVFAHE